MAHGGFTDYFWPECDNCGERKPCVHRVTSRCGEDTDQCFECCWAGGPVSQTCAPGGGCEDCDCAREDGELPTEQPKEER